MSMTNRLKEAMKQIQIVKEEVDDPEVNKELEHALEPIKNAMEMVEDDD